MCRETLVQTCSAPDGKGSLRLFLEIPPQNARLNFSLSLALSLPTPRPVGGEEPKFYTEVLTC